MNRIVLLTASIVIALSGCTAEARICRKMNGLCGTSKDSCSELVKQTQETAGDPGVKALDTCFGEANSCAEATGCVAGQGLKAAGAAVGDFVKGLVEGAKDEKK